MERRQQCPVLAAPRPGSLRTLLGDRSGSRGRASARASDEDGQALRLAVLLLHEREEAARRGRRRPRRPRRVLLGHLEPYAVGQQPAPAARPRPSAGTRRRPPRRSASRSAPPGAGPGSAPASSLYGPTRVRRSAVRWPPTPRSAPRSRARARMYVPEEQTTETTRSSDRGAVLGDGVPDVVHRNEETVTGRAGISKSSPSRARL